MTGNSVPASFFSDIIVRKPLLFQEILKFNGLLSPARVSDTPMAEWPFVPGLQWKALLASPRFRQHFFVSPAEGFWDFGEETRRLALVSTEELSRLALVFGVCLYGQVLARLVLREQVLAAREAIGRDLYEYALHRGQFQLGTVRSFFLSQNTELPLSVRIHLHGRQAVALCCALWPEDLRMRVDCLSALPEELPPLSPAFRRMLWFSLKKLLIKEVAPQWAPCFD